MALAVIAEPRFAPGDLAWIAALRARHDPQHRWLPPHVTLVFPAPVPRGPALLRHVAAAARRQPPFNLCLRAARAYGDASGAYVFLLPDQGCAVLIRLHDRLYAGPLRRQRRRGLPFMPHLTVACCATPPEAQRIATRLNARAFAIRGRIDALQLVAVEAGRLRRAATFRLGSAPGRRERASASAPPGTGSRPRRSSPRRP